MSNIIQKIAAKCRADIRASYLGASNKKLYADDLDYHYLGGLSKDYNSATHTLSVIVDKRKVLYLARIYYRNSMTLEVLKLLTMVAADEDSMSKLGCVMLEGMITKELKKKKK